MSAYSSVNPLFMQGRDTGRWGENYVDWHGASKLRGAVIIKH